MLIIYYDNSFFFSQLKYHKYKKIANSDLSDYDKLNGMFILYKCIMRKITFEKTINYLKKYNIILKGINKNLSYNYIHFEINMIACCLSLFFNYNIINAFFNNIELNIAMFFFSELLKPIIVNTLKFKKHKKCIYCIFFKFDKYYLIQNELNNNFIKCINPFLNIIYK